MYEREKRSKPPTMVELAQAVDDATEALRRSRSSLDWARSRLADAEREVPEKEQALAAAKKALRDALPPDPDNDGHSAFAPEIVYEERMDTAEATPIRIGEAKDPVV